MDKSCLYTTSSINVVLGLFSCQFKTSSFSLSLSFHLFPSSATFNYAKRRLGTSSSLSLSPNKRYFVSLSCLFLYLKTLLLLISSSFHLAENPKSLLLAQRRCQRRCPVVFVIFSYFFIVCHFVVGSLALAVFALLSELLSFSLALSLVLLKSAHF